MKLLIVGGGIGGLTAALCLVQAGHEVVVLEKALQFSEVGAGLQCGANAIRVLDSLGLYKPLSPVMKKTMTPRAIEFKDFSTAKNLLRIPLGDTYLNRYRFPYLQIHRADLHGILLEALIQEAKKRPAAFQLLLGHTVKSFIESSQAVSITTEEGKQLSADALIACDGVRSTVARQLLAKHSVLKTNDVAWRCSVDMHKVPQERLKGLPLNDTVLNFVGPSKHVVMYYLRDRALLNFVGIVDTSQTNAVGNSMPPEHASWVKKTSWQVLKETFSGWHDTVQMAIDYCDKDACFQWPLMHMSPVNNWSSDRVTLLGDAAHASLPYMASGAAMAIEDARILQRSLDQASNVKDGLQLYQNNRFDRTKKIQEDSLKAGNLYHIRHRWLRNLAFRSIRLFNLSRERFLANYDANTIELI